MSCSVVIPCHNGVALTRACIDSLLTQTGTTPDEILIVDNASQDETARLDRMAKTVRVLRQPRNLGFAGGVNRGLCAAVGDTVLVLNNDTLAAPNLLSELHTTLLSDASIGACAPVSNNVKGDALLPVGFLGRDDEQRRELAAELQHSAARLQDVDTLSGLCLLTHSKTLQQVGLFDERFGHGNFEDDDFSLRLRLHGYRLVLARRAFLHHEGHATFNALGLELGDQMQRRFSQFTDKWRLHPAGQATIAALRGDWRAAALAALVAQRRCPSWPDADWHLGRYHEVSGDAATAIVHLRSYLRQCPEHVEARLALGLALLRTEQQADGRSLLAATIARHQLNHGQQVRLLQRLGELDYDRSRPEAAADLFRQALQLSPDSGELHNWLGLCLLQHPDHRAAAAAFAQAIEHGYALAHGNLGICRHALGDHQAAAASFTEAVTLLPNHPVALANYRAIIGQEPAATGARSEVPAAPDSQAVVDAATT